MFENNSHYRVFLAVTPSEEVRAEIRDINRKFKKYARNFKFIPLDQLHITLQFLGGSVSGNSLEIIYDNLVPMYEDWVEFEVKLDRLNFGFSGQNIATHLFYPVEEDIELNRLTKSIHEDIKSFGLRDVNKKKDHSKLINHMTIARVKGHSHRSFKKEIKDFINTLELPTLKFSVSKISLISSIYKDNTTSYSEIASIQLKKG